MSDNKTPTPLTDAVVEEIWKDDLGSSYCQEYVPAEHARNLESQLAEAQRDLLTKEEGGEWVSRCDHEDALEEASKDADALRAELATAKADTERLDWLEQGGWEVYPSGRKYCIAHDIYDAVYATELRQAIDTAMKEDE